MRPDEDDLILMELDREAKASGTKSRRARESLEQIWRKQPRRGALCRYDLARELIRFGMGLPEDLAESKYMEGFGE